MKEQKLPPLELKFLYFQREKSGEKGDVMISNTVDKEEQAKKEKKQRKVELDKKRTEDKEEKAQKEKQDLGNR